MPTLRYTFSVDPLENERVVKWLESLPGGARSGLVVEALAEHLSQPSAADILAAIQALATELRTWGARAAAGDAPAVLDGDEPARALDALDRLMERFGK